MHTVIQKFMALAMCAPIIHLAVAKENGVTFPMKHEGGSLPLNQHDKLNTTIGADSVVFSQGGERFEIPAKSITEVSYGADVHRRVGEAIGVGVLTLGIGAMLLLVKTKKHYVGMTWLDKGKDGATEQKGGGGVQVGKGDYRGVMNALGRKTGLKGGHTDEQLGTG